MQHQCKKVGVNLPPYYAVPIITRYDSENWRIKKLYVCRKVETLTRIRQRTSQTDGIFSPGRQVPSLINFAK